VTTEYCWHPFCTGASTAECLGLWSIFAVFHTTLCRGCSVRIHI
jgi:hypothetical protein